MRAILKTGHVIAHHAARLKSQFLNQVITTYIERLKSKRVGFKKLNSARYFNISDLLMLRMMLWKLFSLPLQYTTVTLHIVNEIMRIRNI